MLKSINELDNRDILASWNMMKLEEDFNQFKQDLVDKYGLFENIPYSDLEKLSIYIMLQDGYFPKSIDVEDYIYTDSGTFDFNEVLSEYRNNIKELEEALNEEQFAKLVGLGADRALETIKGGI